MPPKGQSVKVAAPLAAAAASSLDTVTISARKANPKLPGRDTAYQLDLPGFDGVPDYTDFQLLPRPERRRLQHGQSPCCQTRVALVGGDDRGAVHACINCGSLYLFEDGQKQYAVIDSRNNRPLRLATAPTP